MRAQRRASGDEYGDTCVDEALGRGIDNLLMPLFNATSATIYGGSNESQPNIIAMAVLNLPDDGAGESEIGIGVRSVCPQHYFRMYIDVDLAVIRPGVRAGG